MDFRTKQDLYAKCRDEALNPGDERNVDIDAMPGRPRGEGCARRFDARIALSTQPIQLFFSSLPGSGKSTELRRLQKMLSEREGGGFFAVLVDADKELDLTGTVDAFDLLAVLIHRTEREILAKEGKNPDDALKTGYIARLCNWLAKTDAELKNAEFGIPEGPRLTLEMKTRPLLRDRLRKTIANNLAHFLEEVRGEFRLFEGRAKKLGHAGLVVILDSLEKLRGATQNYEEVLASAERLFTGGAPHLALPVHSLLTVPPALYARLSTLRVDFMPVVKVREKNGAVYQNGTDALRELIRCRIPDHALDEILGPKREARVREILNQSGGYPREVVLVLQQLIETPDYPVSDSAFKRCLNERKDRFRTVVVREDYPWLKKVAKNKDLGVESDAHRPAVDRALMNHVVLHYLNDDGWWDLHPAVAQIPGIAK